MYSSGKSNEIIDDKGNMSTKSLPAITQNYFVFHDFITIDVIRWIPRKYFFVELTFTSGLDNNVYRSFFKVECCIQSQTSKGR